MYSTIIGRKQSTIQTHAGVSIPLSGSSTQAGYIDCDGFDKLAITSTCNASASSTIQINWSNDNVSTHYTETIVNAVTSFTKGGIADVKARYASLTIVNNDSSAAHTFSAWMLLKA